MIDAHRGLIHSPIRLIPRQLYSDLSALTYTNTIPFPTETNNPAFGSTFYLPYIAFNYLGQLTDDGQTVASPT